MKSKKKLLLLGVGAMSALALGVGATSTFAWYQAQATAAIATNTAHALTTFSTQTDYKTLTGVTFDLDQLFTISVADDGADLELAYYNAEATGTKNLATGYIDQQRNFHPLGVDGEGNAILVDGENNVLYRLVTITMKVKDSLPSTVTSTDASHVVYSAAEALKLLRTTKIDVSVQATAESRGRAFLTAASEDDTGAVNVTNNTSTGDALSTIITEAGGQATSGEPAAAVKLTWNCYVYVEGGARTASAAQKDDAAVPSGAFTVTFSNHA